MSAETTAATLEYSVRREGTTVFILDRRVFPAREEWVAARTPVEVANAIRDMVTQSSGPLYATCAGMEQAALLSADLPRDEALRALEAAGEALAGARPTNAHPRDAVQTILSDAAIADNTAAMVAIVLASAARVHAEYREAGRRIGRALLTALPENPRILTHCWGEAYLFGLVEAAREQGRTIEWIATETRPYLQGARLTAHSLAELGQHVTLITDGMAAAALASPNGVGTGPIDAAVTAADRVSMDGCVVNKVGTLSVAAGALAAGVPYFAMIEAPDPSTPTGSDIVIEDRDPTEVFEVLGTRVASDLLTDAWYPAFDLTPARLVTGIATSRGFFTPENVADHHTTSPNAFAL